MNNVPFTQFYHINYDMQKPYMVCGGLQDNGNWCGPSKTLLSPGHPQERLVHASAAATASSPCRMMDKPWLVYSDAQGGMHQRDRHAHRHAKAI